MKIEYDGMVTGLLKDTKLPKMFHAVQDFPKEKLPLEDIPGIVWKELEKLPGIEKGKRIAVTSGSRGIRNIALITRSAVDYVKSRGAIPFIVPAMGSHGGATAEGQREILAGYGITEETMDCPIESSMDTVELGTTETGKPVYMDKNAYGSDGIIVVCRVKPHNAFRGTYESGICKMLTVGLGKQRGASFVHGDGMDNIAKNIPAMAKVSLAKAPVLGGLVTIENAYDETRYLEAVPNAKVLEREPELLKMAFANMPKLIVGETDVLVVEEIGKNYSGTGVDPNITGTFSTPYAQGGIKVQRTAFLNLSKESHGNALGCGLASTITRKIFEDMDVEKMYPNCITSTVLASAMIPPVTANDRTAIQLCVKTCTKVDKEHIRMVMIPNSLHVGRIMLSESYYEKVKAGAYPGLTAVDEPKPLAFGEDGNLMTKCED